MAISESLAPSMDLWLMLADPMMMYSSSTEIKQKMFHLDQQMDAFQAKQERNSSRNSAIQHFATKSN